MLLPDKKEHAVVTVMGQDRVGIVAGVSATLAACNVNIIDISQTLLQDIFAMILMVDISGADRDLPQLQEALNETGAKIGVKIVIQHEDIFKYMHRI
jgi:ACT domain-containing protein